MTKKNRRYFQVKERDAVLAEQRNLKMARSSQSYVRGSTHKFYEWLASANGLAVPQGPPIWICGDCHVGNLGPIASTKGNISIQIRDLDQTVIGNPAHDLIRLGLSLASMARGSDFPGITTAKILEQLIEGYERAFADISKKTKENIKIPASIEITIKSALKRKWKHLAKERIEDIKPNIPLGKNFWPLSKEEKAEIKQLFKDENIRRLVTSLRLRDDDARVEVLDTAYWVKGCSSLGNLRYAVLLRIGDKESDLCLIDIKEAVKAVAPHNAKAKMPTDNAKRVVEGAKQLSPALGERMLAARIQERPVVIREMLPQDLKIEIDRRL
jgi:uncharacterized protein (DUF2252 family)